MKIRSSDGVKVIDIGASEDFFSLYSTIYIKLKNEKKYISNAIEFLKNGKVNNEIALVVAKEFNLIRDYLASIPVSELVYDMRDLSKNAPWIKDISPVVTSCGNLFLTKDGKDTLFEIVEILSYSYYKKVDVIIER